MVKPCSRRTSTLVAIAILLAAVGRGSEAVGQTADSDGLDGLALEVMTFNIRTSAVPDGGNAWPLRKEVVAQTIAQSNPHVLGLQEVLAEQIEYLEVALPQYRWLGVDRGLNGGTGLSEATPIFYRYEELIPIESGTFWLGSPPDGQARRRRGSRIVTWARFHHIETARQLYVYNTHFTIREGQRQLESAERVNEHIASLPPGSTVIVMGDFNAAAESSETWRMMTSRGLRDAWTIADDRHGPPVTSNGFGPPPSGEEWRIDWILVGGAIEVPSASTVIYHSEGRYPSDHYPVLATLRLISE